ncbi:YolD-like family protein [Bacillus mexicanus]|uniref:YolD-like family protein n=1 Tax=Bacillus mexicanus TaxID=2834415 RepID=UPI003D1E86A2
MKKDEVNIKWQGFFVPEHIQALRERQKEQKEKSPVLDEQKLEEMNSIVAEGMEHNIPLSFNVYNEKLGHFENINGLVHYVDAQNKQFRVMDSEENIRLISFDKIADISMN